MVSTSVMRATGSGSREYIKMIVLKDAPSNGPWKAKLTSILDVEAWEIVNGTNAEPRRINFRC